MFTTSQQVVVVIGYKPGRGGDHLAASTSFFSVEGVGGCMPKGQKVLPLGGRMRWLWQIRKSQEAKTFLLHPIIPMINARFRTGGTLNERRLKNEKKGQVSKRWPAVGSVPEEICMTVKLAKMCVNSRGGSSVFNDKKLSRPSIHSIALQTKNDMMGPETQAERWFEWNIIEKGGKLFLEELIKGMGTGTGTCDDGLID
ncbi:conserved hypothetical protein [Histoplasma capsulatum H143]|uniref:Uncharacterized protein n=1 Tax=Ajellomyces capsulatus (strain H143) TaxID=544712 RepID=C6H6U5_AJECH|nr:conserved hypothetical protein [Histoplasma capsulatum H143]